MSNFEKQILNLERKLYIVRKNHGAFTNELGKEVIDKYIKLLQSDIKKAKRWSSLIGDIR